MKDMTMYLHQLQQDQQLTRIHTATVPDHHTCEHNINTHTTYTKSISVINTCTCVFWFRQIGQYIPLVDVIPQHTFVHVCLEKNISTYVRVWYYRFLYITHFPTNKLTKPTKRVLSVLIKEERV